MCDLAKRPTEEQVRRLLESAKNSRWLNGDEAELVVKVCETWIQLRESSKVLANAVGPFLQAIEEWGEAGFDSSLDEVMSRQSALCEARRNVNKLIEERP